MDGIIAIQRRDSVSIGDNNKKRAIHIYKHVDSEGEPTGVGPRSAGTPTDSGSTSG